MSFINFSNTTSISGVLFFTVSIIMSIFYIVLIIVHLSAIFYAKYRLYKRPKLTATKFYDSIHQKPSLQHITSNTSATSNINQYYYNQPLNSNTYHRKYDQPDHMLISSSSKNNSTNKNNSKSNNKLKETMQSINDLNDNCGINSSGKSMQSKTPVPNYSLESSKTMKQFLQNKLSPNYYYHYYYQQYTNHTNAPVNTHNTSTNSTASSISTTNITINMLPGVSIVKPVVGIDNNLKVNLASFFTMTYPYYELIFCLPDDKDEALPIIEQLVSSHPHIDCKILIGLADVGVNPKINNIYKGYQIAKYDLVMISDAGIFMKSDTLLDMVDCIMEPEVGLVHQVPFMHPSNNGTFAHLYQLVFFGGWHAKIYMSSAFFSINCTTGMSFIFRRHILDEVGLATFGQYLAEDFFISRHFYKKGWRCVISRQPAWQNSASDTVSQFQNRIMRWYQLRARMIPHTVLLEPLSECFLPGLVMGWFSYNWFPRWINPAVFFLCHVLVWFILDYLLLQSMLPSSSFMSPHPPLSSHHVRSSSFSLSFSSSFKLPPSTTPLSSDTISLHPKTTQPSLQPSTPSDHRQMLHTPAINKVEFLAVWLFKEVVSPFLQIRALFRRTVVWRNHKFRIHLGGITESIPDETNPDINNSNDDDKVKEEDNNDMFITVQPNEPININKPLQHTLSSSSSSDPNLVLLLSNYNSHKSTNSNDNTINSTEQLSCGNMNNTDDK